MTTVRTPRITADTTRSVIATHMLADAYELILDLDASHGSTLVDARDGRSYLDLFTFFASSALGMNHPALISVEARNELGSVAVNKPRNSDVWRRRSTAVPVTPCR